MKKLKHYLKRLKHPGTVIGVCGYILSIVTCLGLQINSSTIMTILQSICGICVLLGIMNNPETKGVDTPKSYTNK